MPSGFYKISLPGILIIGNVFTNLRRGHTHTPTHPHTHTPTHTHPHTHTPTHTHPHTPTHTHPHTYTYSQDGGVKILIIPFLVPKVDKKGTNTNSLT